MHGVVRAPELRITATQRPRPLRDRKIYGHPVDERAPCECFGPLEALVRHSWLLALAGPVGQLRSHHRRRDDGIPALLRALEDQPTRICRLRRLAGDEVDEDVGVQAGALEQLNHA